MKELKMHDRKGMPDDVNMDDSVIYTTKANGGKESHIHAPIKAHMLDWSKKPVLGKIYSYAVISNG